MTTKSMTFFIALFICLGLAPVTHGWGQIPGDFDSAPYPGFAAGSGKFEGHSIGAARSDVANAMALQPDGKIVLAGSCLKNASGLSDFCLARLDTDGILDRTFRGPASGSGNGSFILPFRLRDSKASALTLQPDGKIVVAGFCADGISSSGSASYDEFFCLARLNWDGSLDVGFGGSGDGQVILKMGVAQVDGFAVVAQPDGKIVMGGYCFDGIDDAFCFARLNQDGSLDSTFNGPGGAGPGKVLIATGVSWHFQGFALALQPDGSIVAAGNALNYNGSTEFYVVRLKTSGGLDTNFVGPGLTGNGQFSVGLGTRLAFATSLALQRDGRIVIGGHCSDGASTSNSFCLARLHIDGTLDTSFTGPSGAGAGQFLLPMGFGRARANAIALQRDQKILITGSCVSNTPGSPNFCIARLTSDGDFDKTFDGPSGTRNGKFVLPIGPRSADFSTALAVQPDDKVLVAGSCLGKRSRDFCVARLHGGP
jgi:uncharacterized delta-60 repeat protein